MLPKLFFIPILSFFIFTHFCMSRCIDHQKNLLLQLKNELNFNSSLSTKLAQWNHTNNCCHWHGVECDGAGHVISLQLNHESISGGIGDSSTLFRLKYLEKLNLAYNNFNYTPLPKGIGNLTYLTHLNLSYAGFSGQVPLKLSFLRRLLSLDISHYTSSYISSGDFLYMEDVDPPKLKEEYQNLEMLIQNLSGLENLYLDGVNIISSHEITNWSHIISLYLPNITTLSLVGCSLAGPLARSFGKLHSLSVLRLDYNDLSRANLNMFANFPSLTTLSLVDCNLKGSFPNEIFQIPTLQYLDLSFNEELSGSLPPFPQNGSLKSIRLRWTNLSGLIPSSIGNLKTLSEIDLSYCKFRGPIPSTFANLTQLTYVDLSSNFFTGSLSSTMFEGFSSLVHLDLGINSFTGNIPGSLFPLPSLDTLYLHNNKFIGVIEEFPTEIVSKIVSLDLSNNRLEGPVPESFFQLESLETLRLHGNSFSGTFLLDKIQSFANLTLFYLDISSNNFSGGLKSVNFSSWKGMFRGSYAQFGRNGSGFNFSEGAKVGVRITMKGLELEIVKIFPEFTTIDFSCNNFRGEIPKAIGDLSSLRLLNLSHNGLNGSIPKSFGKLGELESLDLSRNKLKGHIPTELSRLTFLSVLNVSYNELNGEIPKGRQLQTFSADSFLGNPGLCGFNLNKSCITEDKSDEKEEEKKREIEWEYVSAALGYAVGLGSFVWLLISCQRFRVNYFGKIEEVVEDIFDARDRRRRRRSHERRVERNRVARRH